MTAKSDRLRAHITKLITKDGYARRQAIAIAYQLEAKGWLTQDGKVKEKCKNTKKCKRGRRKGSRSCKRKPGPKSRTKRKSRKRTCKRGRRKGSRSCKRKPGPKRK